ncbi:MAG: LPXTG-motif cell wall anchor domain protein, partial [Clostridia bacterium]|nr:LPXTG-motif cell wall anchor domain protein [Clostridia bacterium]
MKKRITKSSLSVLLALLILFSSMLVPIEPRNVFADGTGTWENPYTVTQAIPIQNNSIAAVQGYIVGQPTGEKTVLFSNFTGDTAIAIADNPGETDTTKMLYVQLLATPAYIRATYGLKTNPGVVGTLVKCTGNLTSYFTPHAGLKSTTAMESVNTTPVAVTGIILDKAELQLASGDVITITAKVLPENASNKNVVWSTDNEACATVNNGSVKAEGIGNATITAKTEEGAFEATCAVVVLPSVDKKAPVISNIKPESGQSTGGDIRPAISASYADESGVAIESVKVYFDEMDVTEKSNINENGFTYMPDFDLSSGIHKVKLVASDKAEAANTLTYEWSFFVGEQEYSYYFGQLHSHTNLSDGQGTPDEAFKWARDVAKADFFAVTDHSNWFDNDTKANINDGSASAEWTQLLQKADTYNKDGEFVAIGGFEMTWSGSTGGWGHINTYNTAGFETRSNSKMDLKTYYNAIAGQPQSISQLNHPGKTFGDFGDFGFYSPAADAVVKLIEVGNGEGAIRSSGYFPSYEYYTRALDKGWHIAPSNNQDNHKANWVTANEARTVVIAPSLTRESIYDAIRNMRVYATEDSNLQVMYKVNGQLMGSSLSNPEALEITIDINDPDATDKIGKVSIISNGGQIVSSKNFEENTAAWQLTLDPKYSYYYVRIDQSDKDIAVTAPVWTGEVVPVGISKVELSQNPQIIG